MKLDRYSVAIRFIVLVALVIPKPGVAQQSATSYTVVTDERLKEPEPENWLFYRGTYNGWGYSPLEQINSGNVESLVPVWAFSTGVNGGHEAVPIVNDGIMFVTTPGNQVIAIDARTGDLLWLYQHELAEDAIAYHYTNRGVALYGDKVFTATLDAKVVALDATSGEVVWDASVADNSAGYYMTLAPLTAEGKVMVGVSGGELGIRGFVVALDTETGEEVWRAHTIPAPGEPGNETWPGDSWRTGGAAVWLTGHYDPDLGLTYWGTGNPGPWMGDARPGDNLYTNSVLALDVETGELVSHHQYHWNGSWDWDEVSTPLLIDVEREGRAFPALVHPGRNGYLWLLERGADEISFVDAWPYVRQDVFTSIDPESGRPTYDEAKKPGIGFRAPFCPSLWGGKDWPPAAYNPGTGLLYIPVNENLCGSILGREVEYEPGRSFTGAESQMTVWPGAEHIGELQAWDMNTGEEVWTREFESPNWGPVLTTAGNLVFMGGTTDRNFRAFDARTGDQLWEHGTNSGVIGVPSTYMIDGVQYIAVQSGWGVDAASMTRRINRDLGTEIFVPEGGVIWVFALQN
ncbi:MAG: PQQ-dependent dehydrogenase, methanol/ethanol family [Gemmatimonadota bacterium]|nr:PQQ-dependent dehydrogenase, methanol/ethanol family [Gemmatimonadota bacterium]